MIPYSLNRLPRQKKPFRQHASHKNIQDYPLFIITLTKSSCHYFSVPICRRKNGNGGLAATVALRNSSFLIDP